MDINYELYKVLYHIVVTLNSSEAPKQLFIPQPTVSQPIKVLEKKLNQPLFIRGIKRVQLTPESEILLKYIELVMNSIKWGEDQLLEAHTLNGGRLRIGAGDAICHYYLVPYLNQFHKEFPSIHIKATNQISIECTRFLESGQADFIVANYPNSALAGNIHTRVIDEFYDVLVTSRSAFPLEDKKPTLEELLDYPAMMLDRKSTTSKLLHQIFQESQLDLVPEIEFFSNDLLTGLARIGFGITFASNFCIPAQGEGLFILNLKEQFSSRQTIMVYNESLPAPQIARQFMDILQQSTPGLSGPRVRLPSVPYYSG